MKKNKIIIPAMAMILFSTAASISGTVAWFTASRVFQTEVGNFSVVEIDGNLKCEMAAGQGTILDAENNSVSVINTDVTSDKFFQSEDENPAHTGSHEVDYYYKTSATAGMYHWAGSAWEAATPAEGTFFFDVDAHRFYKISSSVPTVEADPAVLTHGSVDHSAKKAYTLDPDSSAESPAFLAKGVDSGTSWQYKPNVEIPTKPSGTQIADVYVAVSWKMTFTYTFAGDSTPVALYLDTKESKFTDADTPNPDFTKNALGTQTEHTKKGFRIAFMNGTHPVVWGNHVPLSEDDIDQIKGEFSALATYSENDIVVYNGTFYKSNADITEAHAWNAGEWTQVHDCPLNVAEYAEGEYNPGDLASHNGDLYCCKEAVTSGNWAANQNKFVLVKNNNNLGYISDASIKAYNDSAYEYHVGDIVRYENRVYTCTTAITTDGSGFSDTANWSELDVYGDKVNYTASNYVWTTNEYTRLENLAENKTFDPASNRAERIGVIEVGKVDGEDNTPAQNGGYGTITIECAAWFEGTDPNVISGAAMECLKANMTVYARKVVNS